MSNKTGVDQASWESGSESSPSSVIGQRRGTPWAGRIGAVLAGLVIMIAMTPNVSSAADEGDVVPQIRANVEPSATYSYTGDELQLEPPEGTIMDDAAPAYYLYLRYTGEAGPCSGTYIGTYQGVYTLPSGTHYQSSLGVIQYYSTVYVRTYKIGNQKFTEYRHRGFNNAFRYRGCYNYDLAYRYYGNNKVSRLATRIQNCYWTSCTPGTWQYGSWRNGW